MKKLNNNTLTFKEYIGSINFSPEDNCLFGKVLGIEASITYEGTTPDELRQDFITGIEDYLQYCKDKNIEPQKSVTNRRDVARNVSTNKPRREASKQFQNS